MQRSYFLIFLSLALAACANSERKPGSLSASDPDADFSAAMYMECGNCGTRF